MKNLKLGLFILVALVLVLVPLLSGCTTPAEEEEEEEEEPPKELEIGALFGFTGPMAAIGEPVRDGVTACADWINDKGGLTIKGEKYLIKIVSEDHKSTPEGAIAAANILVYDRKVEFIVGPIVPFIAMAVAPITEEAEVLRVVIDGWGLPEELNPDLPYTFKTTSGLTCVAPTFDFLVENYPEVETVAMIGIEEPSVLAAMEYSKGVAEALGLEVVLTETFPFGTEDFYPVWTKVIAANVDAVNLGGGVPAMGVSLFKQGRELGFTGPMFAAGGGIMPLMVQMLPPEFATDFFCADIDVESPEMPPIIAEIVGIMEDRYGKEFLLDHIFGWNALWVLAQAIEEAQSLNPTEVAQSWENMESLETAFGTAYMGGLETYGINHEVVRPFGFSQLMNGEVEFIKWILPELP
jgi:branched-chain amino acid transport system substrate-binding protein